MKIAVSAESTIDLPKELLEKYNIQTRAFGINFKDKLVEDYLGISEEIFRFVEETKVLPKTSAIGPAEYKEYFEGLLKDNDVVIHVSLSSNLSSSYNNARLAAEELGQVYVIDSRNLSTGIALLAIYVRSLVDKGLEPADIVEKAQSYTKRIRSSFILDKLNYMHKGGRCSAVTLLGANLLKIKPQIVVNDGRMGVGKKYRGTLSKVIDTYTDDVLAEYPNANKSLVFITHSSPMPEEEKIVAEKLKKAGFKEILNTLAGGTICSHCGPNTLGILFVENE